MLHLHSTNEKFCYFGRGICQNKHEAFYDGCLTSANVGVGFNKASCSALARVLPNVRGYSYGVIGAVRYCEAHVLPDGDKITRTAVCQWAGFASAIYQGEVGASGPVLRTQRDTSGFYKCFKVNFVS